MNFLIIHLYKYFYAPRVSLNQFIILYHALFRNLCKGHIVVLIFIWECFEDRISLFIELGYIRAVLSQTY